MMATELLMVTPMMPHVMEALDRDFQVHRLWEAEDRQALLSEVGGRVKGIATNGHAGASAELMSALPNLEVISCFGVGYDGIDVEHAKTQGVIVTNTPDVLTEDVADIALVLMLGVCRRIPQCDRYVREGKWLNGPYPLTDRLGGHTAGILGLGRIGKAIARRAEVCGMSVAYHGRREQTDQPYTFYADLAEMAAAVDYLVVACPGGAETDNLVNRRVLEALGEKGTLINIARGSVVDESALVELLLDGKLRGAGLDVFADEPKVPEALFALDNVVLLPHVGSASNETRKAMGDLVVDNLVAHFAGKPVLTQVT